MGIMDNIMPLPEPSQAIIDSMLNAAKKRQELDYAAMIALVEKWKELLMNLPANVSFLTRYENGSELTYEDTLLEMHMDLEPLGNVSKGLNFLGVSFNKGGVASTWDCEVDDVILKRYERFFGFEGTWEEVARKMIEIADLVAAENTPPPIPDDLQQE